MLLILNSIVILSLAIVSILYFRRRRLYELAAKIPGPSGQLPLIGICYKFIGIQPKDCFNVIAEVLNESAPIQKIWFGPKLLIVPNTPEMVKTVLTSSSCLNKPSVIYDAVFCPNSLISSNGSMQEKHRRILNMSMTPSMLSKINLIINEKVRKCMTQMAAKVDTGEFNVIHKTAACTLEALIMGNFQYDQDCYDSDFLKACENALTHPMQRMMKPWLSNKLLFYLSDTSKLARETLAPIHNKISDILAHNKHLRVESDEKQGIFINQLLNLRHNFSEDEIRDEAFILIMAGYETTATTLAITLLLLAMHKYIQQKVIDEIDSANLDEYCTISNEQTQNFPYIEMVIKEAMRLFPVGPFIVRETTAEVDLNGYTIPKNAMLMVPTWFMHRSEQIWGSDAKSFNPEHFRPESMAGIHPYAFVPFSGGKRICLGYKYAMYFMKIFIVNFFKLFEVDTSLKFEEIRPQVMPLLSFANGYPVSVKRRAKRD